MQAIHWRSRIGETSSLTHYFPEASSINLHRRIVWFGCAVGLPRVPTGRMHLIRASVLAHMTGPSRVPILLFRLRCLVHMVRQRGLAYGRSRARPAFWSGVANLYLIFGEKP